MTTVVDELVVTLGLDPRNFDEGQKKAATAFLKLRDEALAKGKQVEGIGQAMAQAFSKVRNEVLALSGAILGANSLAQLTQNIQKAEFAVGRMSKNLGMGAADLSAWQYAAKRMGGSAEEVTATIAHFNAEVQNIQFEGTASAFYQMAKSMERIEGTKVVDFVDQFNNIRPAAEIMKELLENVKVIQQVQGTPQAYAWGKKMGFDEGTLAMALQTTEAIQSQLDRATKLGVITQRQVDLAKEEHQAWSDLREVFDDLARAADEMIKPELIAREREFTKLIIDNKGEILTFFKNVAAVVNTMVDGLKYTVQAVKWLQRGGMNEEEDILSPEARARVKNQELEAQMGGADNQTAGLTQDGGFMAGLGRMGRRGLDWFTGGKMERTNHAMRVLQQRGYTRDEAAGITSNLLAESSLDPTIDPSASHKGIAQWSPTRWAKLEAYAKAHKLNPADVDTQLEYFDVENRSIIKGAGPRDAAGIARLVSNKVEIPHLPGSAAGIIEEDKRAAMAKEIIDKQPRGPIDVTGAGGPIYGAGGVPSSTSSTSSQEINVNGDIHVNAPGAKNPNDATVHGIKQSLGEFGWAVQADQGLQ